MWVARPPCLALGHGSHTTPVWTIGIQLLLYTGVTEEVWACQVAQWVKNLPAMQEIKETWGQSLSQGDPLEEGMATHSSIPA